MQHALFAIVSGHFYFEHAILYWTSQPAVTGNDRDLVLAHQELESFRVLGDDLILAILNGTPIHFHAVDILDTVLLRRLEVVVDLGVEQQALGRDTAYVQACAAELRIFFDQCDFQSILSAANRGRIAARTGANDGCVVDSLWQLGLRLLLGNSVRRQTLDCNKQDLVASVTAGARNERQIG